MMHRSSVFLAPIALLVACAGAQPEPVGNDPAVVIPPATAAPSAVVTAAPVPSAAPIVAASAAPSSAPSAAPVDDEHCRPKPPAVTFDVKDDDVVIPRDAAGCRLGESHFKANGYSYKVAVEWATELQRLLKAGDKKALSALANYPLRVNLKKGVPLMVTDPAGFVRDFDRIFPKSLTAAILAADPRDVSAGATRVMLGDGIVFSDMYGARFGLTAVNVP